MAPSESTSLDLPTAPHVSVGSRVRAMYEMYNRTAVIATIDDDSATVELDWDTPTTIPSSFCSGEQQSPAINDDEEPTTTVPVTEVSSLYSWEDEISLSRTLNSSISAEQWKERGDRLLQRPIRDPSAAAACYINALGNLQPYTPEKWVGSSLLMIEKGRCVLAEVDCYNDDDETLDITISAVGDEKVISTSEARLIIYESDEDIQERCLLNLARCCLQLKQQFAGALHQQNRSIYLHRAVLFSTLALTILEQFRGETHGNSETIEKPLVVSALLLRSQAQEERGKLSHARADLERIRHNNQARERLRRIDQQSKVQARQNRQLARNVSRWVQTAVSTHQEEEACTSVPASTSLAHNATSDGFPRKTRMITIDLLWIGLAIAVVAFLVAAGRDATS